MSLQRILLPALTTIIGAVPVASAQPGDEAIGACLPPVVSSPGTAEADEQPTESRIGESVMLAGDWVPKDPHQIDYSRLPRVNSPPGIQTIPSGASPGGLLSAGSEIFGFDLAWF